MNFKTHHVNGTEIAELVSNEIVIQDVSDGVDLIGNVYYQGFDKVIVHRKNLTDSFFDLKNQMAGEILQKFSTYRLRLVIVGDFSPFPSKSLRDFIRESNQGKQVNFLPSVADALEALSR